jgi:AcrR family transcriptional regulator
MNRSERPRRRGRPPKDASSNTRERILEAALDAFARHGFAATSLRQITGPLGITASAIYAHFDGKQAILDALLEEGGPLTVMRALDSLELDASAEPARTIEALVDRVVDAWDQPVARGLLSLFLREGGFESGEAGSIQSGIDRVMSRVAALLRAWRTQGRLRDVASAEQLAFELFAALSHIRMLYWHASATPARRRQGRALARRHVQFFVAAVFVPPRKKGARS